MCVYIYVCEVETLLFIPFVPYIKAELLNTTNETGSLGFFVCIYLRLFPFGRNNNNSEGIYIYIHILYIYKLGFFSSSKAYLFPCIRTRAPTKRTLFLLIAGGGIPSFQ